MLQLSSSRGSSQIPQLSKAKIWIGDSSFHEGISVITADLVPDTATVNYVTGCESSSIYSCCVIWLFVSSHPPFLYSIATLHWFSTINKRAWRQKQTLRLEQLVFLMASCPKERQGTTRKETAYSQQQATPRQRRKHNPADWEEKVAVGFWIYFTLLDGSRLKILCESGAQRKPRSKAHHCTHRACENVINPIPCSTVQSPVDMTSSSIAMLHNDIKLWKTLLSVIPKWV